MRRPRVPSTFTTTFHAERGDDEVEFKVLFDVCPPDKGVGVTGYELILTESTPALTGPEAERALEYAYEDFNERLNDGPLGFV